MALFLLAAQSEHLQGGANINAVLVNGANAAAARAVARANRPPHIPGAISDATIDAWSATQLSASDGTLIGGAPVMWIQGRVPAAGLGYRGN